MRLFTDKLSLDEPNNLGECLMISLKGLTMFLAAKQTLPFKCKSFFLQVFRVLQSYPLQAIILLCCSEGMKEVDKESEVLHRQLLEKEVDLPSFVQKYKKLRTVSHRRALLRLAAKTSGLTA